MSGSSSSVGEFYHCPGVHLRDGGGEQHGLRQHPGPDPVQDVPVPLLQPDVPDDDLRHLCQLRLHAPRGHCAQRNRVQRQQSQDNRHDEGWFLHEHYLHSDNMV